MIPQTVKNPEESARGTELRRRQWRKQAKRKSNEGERGGAASGAHEGRAQCAKQAVAVEAPKGWRGEDTPKGRPQPRNTGPAKRRPVRRPQ